MPGLSREPRTSSLVRSGSGKTFRTCSILQAKEHMIEDGAAIRNVVFCYAAWQPIYERLKQTGIVTKFVGRNPSSQEFVDLVKDYRDCGGSIVVIDDFMSQINQDMVDIVTVQSRHYNTTTFILFQSLFPPNKLARQISLNVKYIHAHKNPRENAQMQILARQLSPRDSRWIVDAYHHVTSTPHSCFLIGSHPEVQRVSPLSEQLPFPGQGSRQGLDV